MLISFHNPDWSHRAIPLPLGANLSELDTPAWWLLHRKETMYYDGRTPVESVRTNMQFIMAEKSLDELKALEPTFADIRAYLLNLRPPKYPFPIDAAKAERGKAVFAKSCAKCHGTYGPDGDYPNVIVALKEVGTDPQRELGMSRKLVEHYNSTWFGEHHPGDLEGKGYQAPPLDGIWATAPYLHNGSVPTLHALLKSSERPKVFRRQASTDFKDYDRVNVGWLCEPLSVAPDVARMPTHEARYIFDAGRFGLSNGGHTFGDKLSEDDRMALIEYLKTL
jgi:mono/diheme cytochrome c family protein